MLEIIIGWLILSAAIWGTAALLPGVKLDGYLPALGVAAVFAVLNFFFGWLVFALIGIGTLGIGFILFFVTQWIVNALMLWFTGKLVKSFQVETFGWALVGALLISVFAAIGQWIVF